jgi:hypothetical protein
MKSSKAQRRKKALMKAKSNPNGSNAVTPKNSKGDAMQCLSQTPPPKKFKELPDKVIIYCEHKSDRNKIKNVIPFLELVPDKDKTIDKLTVEWHGPNKPKAMVLKDTFGKELSGFDFDCKYQSDDSVSIGKSIFRDLFSPLKKPTVYELYDLPFAPSLKVKLYSSVQWELKIKLPLAPILEAGSKLVGKEFKDQSYSKETNYSEGNKMVETSKKSGDDTTKKTAINDRTITIEHKRDDEGYTHTTSTTKTYTKEQDKLSGPTRTVGGFQTQDASTSTEMNSELPITLTRNGSLVGADLFGLIASIINLAQGTFDIVKMIQDNVPQVGWYMSFNVQFFQGDFVIRWGKKEFEDHRAYTWIESMVEIDLISGEVEIGVGISGFSFKAQAFGKLSGAISLSFGFKVESPEGGKFPVELEGEIAGALGARVEVGYFANIEGTVETGITATGNVDALCYGDVRFEGKVAIAFSGITAKVEGGIGKGDAIGSKSFSAEKELVPGSTIKEWELFKSEEVSNDDLDLNGIINIIHDTLNKGWFSLRIVEEERYFSMMESTIDLNDIARDIALKIISRPVIKKDEKTIEAFSTDVRTKLQEMSTRGYKRDGLPKAEFDKWLKSGQFNKMLKSLNSPAKILKEKCKRKKK